MTDKRLHASQETRYFSRELSWLAFNDRVLDEAADSTNPLLERLKFLSIVSSNLEEFFMVRLAQLYRLKVESEEKKTVLAQRDFFDIETLLQRTREWVMAQKTRQTRLFNEIKRDLAASGLVIEEGKSELALDMLKSRVLPFLESVLIKKGERLPFIHGSRLYLLARHGESYSLVTIPKQIPRLMIVKSKHVFMVDRLIASYPELAFAGQNTDEIFSFKVSRDAQIEIDEDAEDPLQDIELALKDRENGPIVRVEVDAPEMSDAVRWFKRELGIDDFRKFYQFSLPLDLKAFMQLYSVKRFPKLRATYPEPTRPKLLPAGLSVPKFFALLDKNEFLLHHPFSSFDPVVDLVKNAAADPKVTRVCQTLYRTSGNSPVLEALTLAAKAGKKVTVLVELKARFDEANNIRWARMLEKAGAKVIYGASNFKIHAKVTYVERKLAHKIKTYVHVSTGNYHPKTARLYTDLGLMSPDPALGADARMLFDLMETMDAADDYGLLEEADKFSSSFKTMTVAPKALHSRVIEWIHQEIACARNSKPSGIRAKMNGLVERDVIDALYEASQAGVKVDLIVRGICCLRPGVPGLSENIRVRSVVDKYLEHSRIFIFENGGNRQIYLSSADWMPRNFFRRVELAIPVKGDKIKSYLSDVFWDAYERDNVRARECRFDGTYHKVLPWGNEDLRAQYFFESQSTPEFKFEVST